MFASRAVPPHRLSKSRFVAGVQCHKLLWWKVHEPDAPELQPDAALRSRLDFGAEVGAEARRRVPGGVLIDVPAEAYEQRVEATAAALRAGARVIYEAAFVADDTFVAVDILERQPGGAWTVIEVKSSTSVTDEHLPDVAIQVHVARRAGLEVARAELMHLNAACRYPDLDNLFVREDVTPRVEGYLLDVPGRITAQLRALAGPLPDVKIGEHCRRPRECPFWDRCWGALPAHHVTGLYGISYRRAAQFERQGWVTIHDLPEDAKLSPIQTRQARAVRRGEIVVEPGLRAALDAIAGPVAHLDFESVNLPIPRWTGLAPWEPMPVQFSCDVELRDGSLEHHEWLADGPGDPRREQAELVVEACAGANAVVVYNAPFERACLGRLGDAVPPLRAYLDQIAGRLVDLLPLVRRHVYAPGFDASFTLKSVVPALVPDFSYAALPIQDGGEASARLADLLFDGTLSADARRQLRQDLLRYCRQDTLATVRLLARLRQLSRPRLLK